jgi:type VI secretion system protein ImpA
MASPPILDFNTLEAPIPGDAPAGVPLPFELRETLTRNRIDDNPENFPESARPTLRKADWKAIVELSKTALTKTSKDLLAATRLLEALVKLHGFAGLRDGLRLLRILVEKCWDRIHPTIEDGDLDLRAGPFLWLDDPGTGARFPSTLRLTPLISHEGQTYCLEDWNPSAVGKASPNREGFERAAAALSLENCQRIVEDMTEAQAELRQLSAALTAKMGPAAPALIGVREALEACVTLMQQILARKRPPEAPKSDTPTGPAEPGKSGVATPSTPVKTRAEAYRQIAQAAAVLKELEPHSPIPYLIQRAVELGSMPFPELIKDLVRDPKIVQEMNRELGIKDAPVPPAKK